MANRIQLRRGSAQEWANVNPTLAIGELGIEIDTGRIKIGDGVTSWNSLKYERPPESISNSPNTLIQRDADGNFQAGAITGSLIGNAATSTRLANSRQIALTGDVTASATFDGSANLNLTTNLQIIPTLPHYDGTNASSGTYTKVTVDARGRITTASNPTTITDYGLGGTTEGSSAQAFDRDLQGIADLTTTGIITRVSDGNIATRTITGTAGRISITNGSGVVGNPILDLINTTVTAGTYNTPTVASATQTLKATKFTVDAVGRFTAAEDFPIATAVEGTTASAWITSTSYARYVKVTNGGRLYQALNTGTSGATAPTHTSGDASDGTVSWRDLGLVTTRQKGLASFDQEDFDVDVNGHVVIAAYGVDNTQLQNNQIHFADGNSYTSYELDNELTASTGYRGITTINNLSVNNTSGSPLLKCLSADDNVDINTTTSTIFSDITLDKTLTNIQTIQRAGSLTLLMNADTSINRFLRITANNDGTGEAKMEMLADDSISVTSTNSTISLASPQQISLISSSADVRVEDFYFAGNILSSTNSTIVLDPAGIGDNTGSVQIKGNLQVDGTTVTVNSTTMTVDDPIISLGGDTTPTIDDNKDRGVEFRYYDTEARLGFYGWDDSYSTLASTTGGYRFLYNATNTSEVFSGTDAGIIAGNLALSSNVGSTNTTSGTLVVTGGTGISQNLWVGGTANVAGNTTLQGTLGVTDNVTLNKNVTIVGSDTAATELFKIQNASVVDKFVVDSSSGNTTIQGTLGVTNATTLSSSLGVTGVTTLTGNLNTQSASVVNIQNTAINNISGAIAGTAYASLATYGVLKVDGGASFAKGVIVGGDLKIYGQFDVDGSVSYSGNTVFKGNVSVDNDGTSPFKFNVTSTTGAVTTIGVITTSNATDSSALGTGALVVSGGGASINNQLRVGGATTITGNTTLNSNVTIVGSNTAATELFKIQNASSVDKFTVDSSSGNTTIIGTLGVQDVVTLSKNTDSSALGTGALVVSAGGASINNQLRVGGDTTLTGDLAVNGGDLTTTSTTATLFNTTATTLNIGQAATTVSIGAITGTCTIRNASTVITGNLTVNGTTTTVNATTITVDDPVLTLGGDTAPSSDDNKDRGIEFRYFDVSAKSGFFGWDDSFSGYRFLENATNSSEIFSGTDARIYAGRLNLTTGTTSTTSTSGALIVTGGVGISENLNVGGNTTLTGLLDANGGATIDNIRIGIASDNEIDTSSGDLTIDSAGGTTTIDDILNISGVTSVTSNTAQTVTGVSYTSDGAFRVTGGVGVAGNVAIGGDLRVFGASVISGGVTYSGTQSYSGVISQSNVTDASSSTDTAASISTAGGVAIAKQLRVGGNTTLTGSLGVTGATTLSSTLAVTSLITANAGITIVGSASAGEDFTITNGTSTKFTVGSSDGNILTEGNLTVKGNSIIGNDVSDTLTVNATATFNNADIVGTIRDARQWTTARTLSYTGDATGSMSVSGSGNVSAALTLATVATAGTYKSVTVNTKGLVTSGTNPTTIAGYGITDAQGLDVDLTAVAGLTTTGIIIRSGNGTAVTRSIAISGTGFSISNADGILGNPTITSNASNNNSANTIVARDALGNFTAGTITAALIGNASTATALQSSRTFELTGDVVASAISFDGTGNVSLTTTIQANSVALGTDTTGNYVASVASGSYITGGAVGSEGSALTIAVDATTTNTASKVVARDATGNFAAGTITAALTGNVTGNVSGSSGSCTGNAATVTTNANLTGHITSVGNAATLGSFTSAQLATALTDETGTGANVFATSPTLVTPVLGTPSSGTLTNCTFPTLNQNTTGNAATATILQTPRTINGVSFDGSVNISITPVYTTSNQNGNATKTAFSVNSGRTVNDIFVIVNGLVLAPTAEYTYTNTTTKTSTGGVGTNTFITVASTTGLVPGMEVSGTGIGIGSLITTIVGTQINLSIANTASTVGNLITFGSVVTLTSAPAAGTNNVSIRYLPLLN